MSYCDTSIPWAIQPEQLRRIDTLATEHLKSAAAAPQAAMAFTPATMPQLQIIDGGVAVIDITGPLTKGYSWMTAIFGGTSMQMAAELVDQAADNSNVKGILLRIDSPGGSVDGTESLARAIRAAGDAKSVIALASGCMASAAYWVGSAANAVYLEAGTTIVGSIGVVTKHTDISSLEARIGLKTTEISSGKYKRIASMHEPLSADGRSSIQSQLDHIYGIFVGDVAKNRGVSVQTVLDRMADGKIFIGQQAIDAGLADGFATEESLINRLRSGQKVTTKTRAQASGVPTRTTAMNRQEIIQAAFEEVGPKGTPSEYQAAIDRLNASTGQPEPRCQRTNLTAEEKVQQAQAHAKAHGCDLVASLKALGFAK